MSQLNEAFRGEIFDRIIDLPDYRLKEILNYIKFLGSKNEETEDPILSVAGCLSGKSLTANEVEEYLYGNIRNDA